MGQLATSGRWTIATAAVTRAAGLAAHRCAAERVPGRQLAAAAVGRGSGGERGALLEHDHRWRVMRRVHR